MENEEVMGGTSDPVDKLVDVDEDDDDLVEVELEDVPSYSGDSKEEGKTKEDFSCLGFL
uniref:Uncharacterized protein n=1 Tax=Fagus sylvatica TaxID=28930 RepID=A0A2N9J121_FAGSY